LWSPRVFFGCREVLEASRREIIDCGGGVRLLGFRAIPYARPRDGGRRMAILLHGWHGSADSADIVSLAQLLFERGYEVLRLNLRDQRCAARNIGLFHSGGEVVGAVRTAPTPHPPKRTWSTSHRRQIWLRIGACRAEGLDLAHRRGLPVVDPVVRCRLDSRPFLYRRCPSANGAAR
jgi:hypothetical protein